MTTPTKDEFGRPLGYYSTKGKCWIWFPKYRYKKRHFYARRQVLNGVSGTLTPYRWGTFKRPGVVGPRGGRAYTECSRQLWYANGMFCRVANVQYEEGKWRREYVPVSSTTVVNDYDPDETETYHVKDGMLVSVN